MIFYQDILLLALAFTAAFFWSSTRAPFSLPPLSFDLELCNGLFFLGEDISQMIPTRITAAQLFFMAVLTQGCFYAMRRGKEDLIDEVGHGLSIPLTERIVK